MPVKPKILEQIMPQKQNQQNVTTIVKPKITPESKRPKKKPTAISTYQQTSSKQQRTSSFTTESTASMNSTQTSPQIVAAKLDPSCQKRRQLIKQQQKSNKSITLTIKKTTSQNPESQDTNLQLGTFSTDDPYPTQN